MATVWQLEKTKNQKQNKLEVHGRARREAAQRRKSECKSILGRRNSSRSNGMSHEKV